VSKKKTQEIVLVDVETSGGRVALPVPPDYLTEEGEKMWFRICAKLSEMLLLTDTAYPQVADYCFNWQIFCFNAREVKDNDTPGVEEYSTGSRGLSANYKAATEARKSMVIFERYWGLNPMALSKITLPQPVDKEDNEFDI